jgi:hypothetical protein
LAFCHLLGIVAPERARVGNLQCAADRAGAQRLLALDLEREATHGRIANQTPTRPPGRRDRDDRDRQPHDERDHPREVDPSRATQQHHARREQQRRQPDRRRTTRRGDQPRDASAFAIDEIDDRHAAGRLVTAYTNRFTPMRSAASCNSGGSL